MTEILRLRDEGLAALQAGDAATSRRCLERVVAAGQANARVWDALALACQSLGDRAAMIASVDRALELDPYDVPALLMKGDFLLAQGDARGASAFYAVAVAVAERAPALSPPLAGRIERARAQRDRINADIERHLHGRLAAEGYDRQKSHPRFTYALELLAGQRQRYTQQPRAFFYPDLPDIQFHGRSRFPWLARLESATDAIVAELHGIAARDDAFRPYIEPPDGRPVDPGQKLLDSADWTAHFLWKDGAPVFANLEHCPRTMAALAGLPLARIRGRAPSVLFSRLLPGAHIPPHTGFLNCRLICHLPLIVPAGCRLRVGNEERAMQRGVAWIFNDTIEHEAWNDSDQVRIILIFDIWHPDLEPEERRLVSVLMRAVDTYGGTPAAWHD